MCTYALYIYTHTHTYVYTYAELEPLQWTCGSLDCQDGNSSDSKVLYNPIHTYTNKLDCQSSDSSDQQGTIMHMLVCFCAFVCSFVFVCLCVYMYTHIYTYIHSHTRTLNSTHEAVSCQLSKVFSESESDCESDVLAEHAIIRWPHACDQGF